MMSRLLIFLLMAIPMALAQQSPDQKLREALATDDLEAAKAALAEGANPNLPTSAPVMTSLFGLYGHNRYAEPTNSWSTHAELKLLLEAGADPNAAIPTGDSTNPIHRTPLLDAVEQGNIEAVRLLLAAGATMVVEDKFLSDKYGYVGNDYGRVANEYGANPLMITAYAHWDTVADQLEAAKGILAVTPPSLFAAQDNCGHNAMDYAIAAGQVELTRFYLDWCSQQRQGLPPDLDCIPHSIRLALRYTENRSFVVPFWTISSPLIGPRSEEMGEPSDPARDLQLVQLLLDYGVEPRLGDVMSAVEMVNDEVGRRKPRNFEEYMLRSDQADKLTVDSALLVIAHSSKRNLDVGHTDGATPLVYASRRRLAPIAQALIQRGASLDAPDHAGKTALIYATQNQDLDLVKALLAAGAKPDRVDLEDKTALDYAQELGNQELVEILKGTTPD